MSGRRPFGWKDFLIKLIFGLIVVFLLWLQPYPWLHPLVWNDAAAGAGLRPPEFFLPGLGRAVMMVVYGSFTPAQATVVLQWLGRLSGGVIAVFALLLFGEMLPPSLRRRMNLLGWGREAVNRFLLLGALFFVCNEAVWCAMQCFSATTVHLLLVLPATWCMMRFLATGRLWCVYASMDLWFILAGDTPVGAFGAIACWALVYWKWSKAPLVAAGMIGNPLVRLMLQRWLTLHFFLLTGAVVSLNIWSFHHLGGVCESGSEVLDTLWRYGYEYVMGVIPSMTGIGWIFAFVFALVPMAVCGYCARFVVLPDRFLPTRHVVLLLVMGVIAWSQLCGFSPLWFRSWIREPAMVKSELAIALIGLMDAVAFVHVFCVLGGDVYFRDIRRISVWCHQDASETMMGRSAVRALVNHNRLLQVGVWVLPLLLAASVLPMRCQATVRQMLQVVADYCFQVARECADVMWVFTDGSLDAGLELAARAGGRRLYPISMMSRHVPYDIAIRQRGVVDEEDLNALESGAPDTLRIWVYDKPQYHADFAVQVGLELWKRERGMPYPRLGGFVARPAGMSEEAAEQGTAEAHRLADAILGLYDRTKSVRIGDVAVRENFLFVQWRVARMCRMRADRYAVFARNYNSGVENRYADDLDARNASFRRIQKQKEWIAMNQSSRLMPREGLRIGLERADYKMAEPFAQNVLLSDPDDANANFALGMKCFFDESYGQSARYLQRVLLRKPDEPSVLNNLAVIFMRMGRYAEAVSYAEKAVKAAPDAPEIKRTLDKAQKLLASAKEQ